MEITTYGVHNNNETGLPASRRLPTHSRREKVPSGYSGRGSARKDILHRNFLTNHLGNNFNDYLPPNTTHFKHSFDVSVFGRWRKAGLCLQGGVGTEHNQNVTQGDCAQISAPVYRKYLSAENIRSGFAKRGLLPHGPERPHYRKLKAAR